MSYIVDRRLNARNKSTVNRQRFLRRYRQQIKRAVDSAVSDRSIKDIDRGEQVGLPREDMSEPVFRHGQGGIRNTIYPGNKEFAAGDRVERPSGGSGGGGGNASQDGEGDDEFIFQISQNEFLNVIFDDLALPDLVRKSLQDIDAYKLVQAGFSNVGIPARLNVLRTMRSAQSRRLALSGGARRRLKEIEALLLEDDARSDLQYPLWLTERDRLKRRVSSIPFLDDFDLKYNLQLKQPIPSNQAVMFCVMDVSGSMDQERKDIAKRFFILLYLFLQRSYEKTEVVFIRHHTSAMEVDENAFFYSRETGGTIVSSALLLIDEIIKERYPPTQWNLYTAQASDGDNWQADSPRCSKILQESLLPLMNYYAYIEITPAAHQDLWFEYEKLLPAFPRNFALRQVEQAADIFMVFKDLFQRRKA